MGGNRLVPFGYSAIYMRVMVNNCIIFYDRNHFAFTYTTRKSLYDDGDGRFGRVFLLCNADL